MTMMKAIHLPAFSQDVSTLRPSIIPRPAPTSSEYLVRITYCSPQHADILHAQGKHQNNTTRGWCHPPFILGFDFAGTVVCSPKDSNGKRLQNGDRVFGSQIGAFAEYICVSGDCIRRIPDSLSSKVAAAMVGQAVSYASTVHVASVKRGETVLVSGASGGLGSVCCMVSKAVGARVIALTGDEEKAELMKKDLNVDAVVVMKNDDWIDQVLNLTDGKGVDVFLDNTGMVNDAIRCLAYFGRIVILGFAARNGVMESVKMNKLLLKSITVVGYRFGESGRRYPHMLEAIWTGYLNLLGSGKLTPSIYGHYHGLEDVGRALEDLHQRKVYGKIVIQVADVENKSRL